eukprot:CAMPEP_0184029440 /NCGR_PEP_ID=MMETSP0955-20130417/486_1 /TAXON_ID=627963 /ORGANISM="Aplanochytrium sp, Strain PBS07" /LENGTH=210 /DNA_ID=CAMNT_0026314503 /DNA_START=251 /DNA_END=883 /DNA_ORIENTATION=-
MSWVHEPGTKLEEESNKGKSGSYTLSEDGACLTVKPDGKRDFWRKTYYQPLLVKNDGPMLLYMISPKLPCTMSVKLRVEPAKQFDQGGLMVYIGAEHWLKTGIEVVDKVSKLSCVVTNRYSDWSTQDFSGDLHIKLSQIGEGSYVVEAKEAENESSSWNFIRIAHIDIPQDVSKIGLGVFACCPEEQEGGSVVFTQFKIQQGITFDHSAS